MTMLSAEELGAFRSAVHQLLEKRSSEADVRRIMESDSGNDPELWDSMAQELGLHGLVIPEEFGGSGVGWTELGVVFEELGASLACVPFLATIGLAAPALMASGDRDAQQRWLPGIAAGELVATAALLGPERTTADDITVRSVLNDDGWQLTGDEAHVLDAVAADLHLVLAAHEGGVALYAVESGASGLDVRSSRTSDLTRRFGSVHLAQTPAVLVGGLDAGLDIADQVRQVATAAVAHEQAGGAQAVLTAAVDYALTRKQFGRSIGSFQAIKHLCANMLVNAEAAKSAAWALGRALDDQSLALDVTVASARIVGSETYSANASTNVQIHGGIGFTWEHGAHLHLKRSRGTSVLFGTPKDNRARMAQLVPVLAPEKGTPT